jgi:hypothetical protein
VNPTNSAAPADLSLAVIDAVSVYQAMPDTTPLRVALAVAATSDLGDEPLWLQIVGGPSSGKSEAIAMLGQAVDGRIADVSLAGLLGWTGGKKGRTTGLLSRIGDGNRLITITDFSTVLADSDRGRRAMLFSFLRVLYDGYVIREIGTAPEPLEWRGRITIISGVTPQIDAFSAHADALGPRWMYCRVPELDTGGRRRASQLARRHAAGKSDLRDRARALAAAAVEHARGRIAGVEVGEIDGAWIEDAAHVATLIRSDVPRDGYGAREINGAVTREEPPRMTIMLTILFRGLVALGIPTRTARRIVVRCALDSTPLVRRQAVTALSTGEVLNTSEIARRMGAERKVARFALEELELLGLVRGVRRAKDEDNAGDEVDDEDPRQRRKARDWTLHKDDGKLAARLVEEVGRSVESLPPSPPWDTREGYGSSHPPEAPDQAAGSEIARTFGSRR